MSSPLANLVARVTGQTQPRLRPRIASRFEGSTMAADGFQEIASEQIVRASEAPIPEAAPASAPPPPLGMEPPLTPPAPSPVPVQETEAVARTDVRVEREPAAHTPPAPQLVSQKQPLFTAPPARASEGREPGTHEAPTPDAIAWEPSSPVAVPPEPLLAAEKRAVEWVEPPAATVTEAHKGFALPPFGREQTANASMAQNEPPEIVINIGRIDLRAPPAPPQAPRPRPQRPKSTDLGDYLRGKGGKR